MPYGIAKPEEVSLPVLPAESFEEEPPPFDLMDISDSEAEDVMFSRKHLEIELTLFDTLVLVVCCGCLASGLFGTEF